MRGEYEILFVHFKTSEIYLKLNHISAVNDAMYNIIGGDCNTDLNRFNSPQTQELLTFCNTEKVISGCLIITGIDSLNTHTHTYIYI